MMRIRSGRILTAAAALAVTVFAVSSCRFFEPYDEYNPDANIPVEFMEGANRLTFGVSTGDSSENSITLNQDGTVNLRAINATNNAGKIAGSEDGISYFFREVPVTKNFKLSADITILSFGGTGTEGETTSNGQEGFGLMARDYVPQYPGLTMEELVGAPEYHAGATGGSGNMVMVGGVKRGVRAAVRTGVREDTGECITSPLVVPDASNSIIEWWPKELPDYSPYPTLEDRPDFPVKNSVYRLMLEKDNNGFRATIIPPVSKGQTEEYYIREPDTLTSIKNDTYYVGFFAARAAEIQVSNISYYESNTADSAPREEELPEILTPSFEILTPETDSDGEYKLVARSNVKGAVSVSQDGRIVTGDGYVEGRLMEETSSQAVEPFYLYDIPVYRLKDGDNRFQIAFYPDPVQDISSADPIQKAFIVHRKAYGTAADPIYVSPSGRKTNAGTAASPLDLETAIAYVLPGQRIIMLDGTYSVLSVKIPRYNSGLYGSPKRLEAQTRDRVFIDFGRNIAASGFVLEGEYWEISGIHVRNTPDKKKGLTIMGSNNLVEWVKTYNNGDTGLQISGRSAEPKSMWPTFNTVAYCESYNNKDAAQEDADGFAAKLTVGAGNRFEWCVGHHNCDDGWDLFTKKETGTIQPVVIENCIAYLNGTLLDGTKTQSGRNGFKLGGEGLSVRHEVTNCLSFFNGAHGFTSNSNPAIQLAYCTSFDNGGIYNLKTGSDSRNFTIYDSTNQIKSLEAGITGLLSLYSNPVIDGVNRKEDKVELKLPANGYVWYGTGSGSSAGTATANINDDTISVPGELESIASPLTSDGFIRRNPDGTFEIGSFLELKPGAVSMPTGADFY